MTTETDIDLLEKLKAARSRLLAAELAETKLARKLLEARQALKKLRKTESELLTELAAPAPMPLFEPAAEADQADIPRPRRGRPSRKEANQ